MSVGYFGSFWDTSGRVLVTSWAIFGLFLAIQVVCFDATVMHFLPSDTLPLVLVRWCLSAGRWYWVAGAGALVVGARGGHRSAPRHTTVRHERQRQRASRRPLACLRSSASVPALPLSLVRWRCARLA